MMQIRRVITVPALLACGVMLAASALLSGCGSGSAATTHGTGADAQSASTPDASTEAIVRCYRSHGDPSFPDPAKRAFGGYWFTQKPVTSGPAFSTAQKACKKLEPSLNYTAGEQHAAFNQLLKFATCMRAHGVPNLPDPNVGGTGFGFAIPNGADPHSQQWQSAQRACRNYVPGR